MDSVPIVCITGQVPRPAIGRDAFQETDITGITLPVTKHNYLVMDVRDIAPAIKEAFYIARTGRPGPVLIDVPKDVLAGEKTEFEWPESRSSCRATPRQAKRMTRAGGRRRPFDQRSGDAL